jgi:hypothetical protein
MTWQEAHQESLRLLAEIQARGETPYLWRDGIRAGQILATMNGPVVRIQGPPPPFGKRRGGGRVEAAR